MKASQPMTNIVSQPTPNRICGDMAVFSLCRVAEGRPIEALVAVKLSKIGCTSLTNDKYPGDLAAISRLKE